MASPRVGEFWFVGRVLCGGAEHLVDSDDEFGTGPQGGCLADGSAPIANACRDHAQIAVDAHPGDLTVARQRGEVMTVDELVSYALDTLT